MSPWLLAVLLFAGGIALILAEFMLPGAVLGIVGFVLLVVAGVIGVSAYPGYAVLIIGGEIVGLGLSIMLGFWLMSRSPLAKFFVLRSTMQVEHGYVTQPDNKKIIGATGVVLTKLRPAGTIEVEGERLDAVADGSFINKGERVRIIEVHGNRVVVEPAPGPTQQQQM